MQRLTYLALLASLLAAGAAIGQAPQPGAVSAKPEAALEAAQQALDAKDYARAVALLEEYLARHPQHLVAQFNLAYGYSLLGRASDAIAAYRKILALDPKLFQAYLNLGLLLLQEGAPAEAVKALAQAIALRPEHTGARLAYADALARSGDTQQARRHYEATLAREPENADARLGLVRLDLEVGAWATAEKHLRHLLAHGTERTELRALLAEALLGQNRLEAAAHELETYLAARPQDAARHEQAARIWRELGRNEAALSHYDRAIALGRGSSELQAARARTLAALERWEEASALLEQLAAAEPTNAEFRFELGLMRLRQAEHQAAVRAFAEAVRLRPDFVEAYTSLALALQLAGDCPGALRALDQRAAHAAENAGTYFLRAICHDRLRQLDAAIDNYERFLAATTDRESTQAFQARARLQLLKRQRPRR